MSDKYSDRECRTIQEAHGVAIPAAANLIEVDGRRLPLANPGAWAAAKAILPLPRGTHAVRFRSGELPLTVTIRGDLADAYDAMREYFNVGRRADAERLLSRSARALDVHGAPYLLNFFGATHAAADRGDAAERHFRRALCVNPAFAPAHLNLAECLARRKAASEAQREVELADALNVGNVFGLAAAINQVRRQLEMPAVASAPIDCAALSYVDAEPLGDDDRRLAALLHGISKYAASDGERAKILNNLAIHYADTGRPERALFHFREALAAARDAGPERFALARRIFANMGEVCRKAGFAEADEYRRMQNMVTP
jgi:tetratricopeptide (TPR) repeat protein